MPVLVHQCTQSFDFHLQLRDLSAVLVLIDFDTIADVSRTLSVVQRALGFGEVTIDRRDTRDHQCSTRECHGSSLSAARDPRHVPVPAQGILQEAS